MRPLVPPLLKTGSAYWGGDDYHVLCFIFQKKKNNNNNNHSTRLHFFHVACDLCPQVPNSSLHPSVCNVSSCQGLDRSSANKYGGSRNRMPSDYEYESASLLYGHVNQPLPPPCNNKRSPDELHQQQQQQQQFNTCCSEGNGIDRCVQSTLPGLAYKHHSGKR